MMSINNKNALIGVDIGGTKIHFARIEAEKVVAETRIPTRADRNKEDIVNDIIDGIRTISDGSAKGIGLGVPGLVDMKEGVVRKVNNIPSWQDLHLRDNIEQTLGIPAFLGNDANCFALGEKYFGKGRGASDLVCLSLGTGVGAGMILNDKLYEGNCQMAGEFGGVPYLDADYELYASGKFFKKFYDECAEELALRAEKGDETAQRAFMEYGNHVGNLLQSIIYSCAPECIILGGSLTKSYDLFRQGINDNLSRFAHPHVIERTRIEISENRWIPVLGAAALAIEMN